MSAMLSCEEPHAGSFCRSISRRSEEAPSSDRLPRLFHRRRRSAVENFTLATGRTARAEKFGYPKPRTYAPLATCFVDVRLDLVKSQLTTTRCSVGCESRLRPADEAIPTPDSASVRSDRHQSCESTGNRRSADARLCQASTCARFEDSFSADSSWAFSAIHKSAS